MKNNKNKSHDYSMLLIWSSTLITVIRYSAAFYISDAGRISGILSEIVSFLMGFTGLGMGVLDVLGGAYIFEGWRKALQLKNKSTWKFGILTFIVFYTIFNGIIILVPFTVSRVAEKPMAEVLGYNLIWFWSIAINIAPYLIIGGAVMGNQGIITIENNKNDIILNGSEPLQNVTVFNADSPSSVNLKIDLTDIEKEYIKNNPIKKLKNKFPNVSEKTLYNWRNELLLADKNKLNEQ